MADITIHDLLAWEPRLQLMRRPLPGVTLVEDVGEREVSWAVTIRAAAPMLSPLRGGELVLLPDRVLAESGLAVPVLLRELGTHNVSAAVVETPPAVAAPIPILLAPDISPEFETDLNRKLTERRGDLYRAGMELGRMLAVAGTAVDLAGLVRTASAFLACPVAVMNARGTVIEQSAAEAVPSGGSRAILTMISDREWRENRYLVRLESRDVLWFGPIPLDRRALVRLAGDRIALAAESILQRRIEQRPRGAARAPALNALLLRSAEAAEQNAGLLGLRADGRYRVALADHPLDLEALQRTHAPLGEIDEAGEIDGRPAYLIQGGVEAESRPESIPGRKRPPLRPAWPGTEWVAISAEVSSPAQLPEAVRQVRFVARLITAGVLGPGPVAFDQPGDVGVYRLLYELRETPVLTSYIEAALGNLRGHDKRGALQATLRVFLDAGGSQTETAAALGIHRNTLAYRLRQIAELTGRDPADPAMRLVMHLALVAATMPPVDS